MALNSKNHLAPYNLPWLNHGSEIQVFRQVLIPLLIRTTYKDKIYCDIAPMDACHILLGRSWQYDEQVTHDGKVNTYNFRFENRKITLLHSKIRQNLCRSPQ